MRKVMSVMVAFATLGVVGTAGAQSPIPLSVEIRGGLPFPTGEFREIGEDIGDGLRADYTVGGSVMLNVTPRFGIYGGYTLNRFQVEDFEGVGVNGDGFDFGVRAGFPTTTGIGPWFKVGGVYHDLEVDFDDDQVGSGEVNVSDRELGFEVGGGVEIPLGQTLSFTPGVSYVRYRTDESFGDRDVSFVKGDVGLRVRF
jgi:opacity protein-like surface antigen